MKGRAILKPAVAIVMGSQSDWTTMKHAADILSELGWTAPSAGTAPLPDLPPDQARVLAALSVPVTLDDLQAAAGLPLPELQTALVMLQLQGLVYEVGGRWSR